MGGRERRILEGTQPRNKSGFISLTLVSNTIYGAIRSSMMPHGPRKRKAEWIYKRYQTRHRLYNKYFVNRITLPTRGRQDMLSKSFVVHNCCSICCCSCSSCCRCSICSCRCGVCCCKCSICCYRCILCFVGVISFAIHISILCTIDK